MKRANEVLAGRGVDPRLAADRRVDHAEQRGRDVDDPNTAQPRCCDPTTKVGRRAATNGDDCVGACESLLAEDVPAERCHLDGLGLFSVRNL